MSYVGYEDLHLGNSHNSHLHEKIARCCVYVLECYLRIGYTCRTHQATGHPFEVEVTKMWILNSVLCIYLVHCYWFSIIILKMCCSRSECLGWNGWFYHKCIIRHNTSYTLLYWVVHDDAIKWTHFRVTGRSGNSLVNGGFPAHSPVTRSFDIFFDLHLNERLFGAKPLPQPMLTHCQLDPLKQTLMKFESKHKTFVWWKCIWKCNLWNCDHFVQGEMT